MYAYRDVGGRPRLEQAVEVVEPRLPAAGRPGRLQASALRRIPDFLSIAATGVLPSRRIPDFLSIAASGILPSRRIPDFLSIAATGVLPSRRIPDFLSINEGRDKSGMDLSELS